LLSAGSRVGPYEVLTPLGAGGMGEVYRARDPRLGREVALKVLPEEAFGNPERLRRFQREARAVASLNHPHILAVYDIGSDDGMDYVVFELLEGETLRRRLESGPLPPRKVVDYGVQICRGLAAAHGKGVIHRDLKPENLFLTAGGQVKILDFGLAKQTELRGADDLARAETRSAITQTGRVLGTAGYMSPEQAQGQPADARSDLFALGAVLYEMLSGRRAFLGSSSADTLAAVLRSDPPRIETDGVPAVLERVVRRCLEKDLAERFQTAHDLGLALETLSGPAPPSAPAARRRRALASSTAARVLSALGFIIAAVALWWLWGRRHEAPAAPERIVPLTADGGFKFAPSLSPDGERVAYSWAGPQNDNWDVYVKAVGPGSRPLRLTEDRASDEAPVWSPDGRQIAFVREQETGGTTLYTVSSFGGPERRLVDLAGPPRLLNGDGSFLPVASWSPDGEWLALAEKPGLDEPARIVRLSLATLEKTPLTSPSADSLGDLSPALSPDGRQLAFVRAASRGWGFQDVWVQPVGRPQARRLTHEKYEFCSGLSWTPDARELVFSTSNGFEGSGRILRVPLAGGTPTPLAGIGGDVAWPSVRADRLAHVQLVPVPWDIWRIPGRLSPVTDRKPQKLIASRRNDSVPAYSPDGHRIAFNSDRSGTLSVWVSDEDGSNPAQLTTFHSLIGDAGAPWSPDGRKVTFISDRSGRWDLYVVDSEGGVPERLTHGPSSGGGPGTFSGDGRSLYFLLDRAGRAQIWKMPAEGGPAVQLTRASEGVSIYFRESPDGRHVYYSNGAGEIWRVGVEGDEETPVLRGLEGLDGWTLSPAGIYYATARPLSMAKTDYAIHFHELQSGRTETLFRREGPFGRFSLCVSPDEKWILYSEVPLPQSELMLVENFR
jgi:Tol biopolymer transport system component